MRVFRRVAAHKAILTNGAFTVRSNVIASATAMLDMRFERASNRGKCACPLSIAKERFLFGMREFIRHTSIHVARGGSMPPLIPPDTPCFPPAGVIFCPLGGGLFLEEPRRHADRFAGLNRDRCRQWIGMLRWFIGMLDVDVHSPLTEKRDALDGSNRRRPNNAATPKSFQEN